MSEDRIRALEARVKELEEQAELPAMMTPRQVCEYMGFSEGTLYNLKKAGDVPPAHYWSERTVRYDRDDVMAWKRKHRAGV